MQYGKNIIRVLAYLQRHGGSIGSTKVASWMNTDAIKEGRQVTPNLTKANADRILRQMALDGLLKHSNNLDDFSLTQKGREAAMDYLFPDVYED